MVGSERRKYRTEGELGGHTSATARLCKYVAGWRVRSFFSTFRDGETQQHFKSRIFLFLYLFIYLNKGNQQIFVK